MIQYALGGIALLILIFGAVVLVNLGVFGFILYVTILLAVAAVGLGPIR